MNTRIAAALTALLLVFTLGASCEGGNSADRADADVAVNQQQTYRRNGQGVPFFDFSQDLETLRQIYVLKNEAVATHSTFSSNGTGQIIHDCPSIGYPIPADTQLTNPETAQHRSSSGWYTLPQPEPNGLFSSQNTDGTWVICVDDRGRQFPLYSELKVEAYPFEVRVDPDGFGVSQVGDPAATVETGGVVDVGDTASEAPAVEDEE
jgi:hypothetical protein